MRSHETGLNCEICLSLGKTEPADRCDSVPAAGQTPHDHNCYRLMPLCWIHGHERAQASTSRIHDLLPCPKQGFARVDRGRVSGEMLCPECDRLYYSHPRDADHPYMNVLCDGSAVKL